MSEKDFNLYVEALDKGLLEAERNVIAANPRFQQSSDFLECYFRFSVKI